MSKIFSQFNPLFAQSTPFSLLGLTAAGTTNDAFTVNNDATTANEDSSLRLQGGNGAAIVEHRIEQDSSLGTLSAYKLVTGVQAGTIMSMGQRTQVADLEQTLEFAGGDGVTPVVASLTFSDTLGQMQYMQESPIGTSIDSRLKVGDPSSITSRDGSVAVVGADGTTVAEFTIEVAPAGITLGSARISGPVTTAGLPTTISGDDGVTTGDGGALTIIPGDSPAGTLGVLNLGTSQTSVVNLGLAAGTNTVRGVTNIGSGTGAVATGDGDLYVSSNFESNGPSVFKDTLLCEANLTLADDQSLVFGTGGNSVLKWSTTETPDSVVWGLDNTTKSLILTTATNAGFDHGHTHSVGHPSLIIYSVDPPSAGDWLKMYHDGNGIILSGGQGMYLLTSGNSEEREFVEVGAPVLRCAGNLDVEGFDVRPPQYAAWQYGNATTGWTTVGGISTPTITADATANWIGTGTSPGEQISTSAISGNVAKVYDNTGNHPTLGKFFFSATVTTRASIADERIWIGMFFSDPTGSDTPAVDLIGFRFRAAADASWFGVTSDGATHTEVDLSTSVVVSTRYHLGMLCDVNSGSVKFYVNGAFVGESTTNLPNSATLAAWAAIETTTTTVKEMVVHNVVMQWR